VKELQAALQEAATVNESDTQPPMTNLRKSSIEWAQHSLETYRDNLLLRALAISAAIADFENEMEKPT
jgi:hypothetical protein